MTTTQRSAHPKERARIFIPSVAAAIAAALSVALVASGTPSGVLEWVIFAQIATGGLLLAVCDLREHRIPDRVLFPLYASTGAFLAVLAIAAGDLPRLAWAIVGGVVLFACYFALGLAGAVGFGDVKLAGLLGLYLTWYGPIAPLAATVLAYLLATPHAAVLALLQRRDGRKRQLPFGPYMVAGAIATATWYLLAN